MAEPNSANPATPPKPGPTAEPGAAAATGEARKLSAVPGQKGPERPQAQAGRPARKGVSRGAFALLVALLVLALVGLFVQTQRVAAQDERIAGLSNQVEGLEFQLSAANTQLATYDMQRTLVRSSVTDLMEQMAALAQLVDADPLSPGPPEASGPPEPPAGP